MLAKLGASPAARLSRPDRLDDDEGLGLVELLIAVLVLTIGLAALAATAIPSLGSLQNSRDRQAATAMATASLERARTYPAGSLAIAQTLCDDPAAEIGEQVVIDREGTLEEAPICAPGGLVDDEEGSPHWYESDGRTVRTWVTEIAEAPTARRITVVVSWQRGSRDFEVRSSTVAGAMGGI